MTKTGLNSTKNKDRKLTVIISNVIVHLENVVFTAFFLILKALKYKSAASAKNKSKVVIPCPIDKRIKTATDITTGRPKPSDRL